MIRCAGAFLAPLLATAACVASSPPPAPPAVLPSPVPVAAKPAPMLASDFVVEGALEQGGWLRGTVPAGAARLTLGDAAVEIAADGTYFAGLDRDSRARSFA